jgi:MoxR-like ATPase
LPEDLQTVFVPAAAHRLTPDTHATRSREALARALLADVPVR